MRMEAFLLFIFPRFPFLEFQENLEALRFYKTSAPQILEVFYQKDKQQISPFQLLDLKTVSLNVPILLSLGTQN